MGIADELQKLEQLHQKGSLTDDEFARAKTQLLATPAAPTTAAPTTVEVSSFLESQMAEVRFQNELARIDREWEIERRRYQLVGRSGRVYTPTIGTGIVTAFVGTFVGVFMIILPITTIAVASGFGVDSEAFFIVEMAFLLIGALMIIWAIGRGIYCCVVAQNYNVAFRGYKRQHDIAASARSPL